MFWKWVLKIKLSPKWIKTKQLAISWMLLNPPTPSHLLSQLFCDSFGRCLLVYSYFRSFLSLLFIIKLVFMYCLNHWFDVNWLLEYSEIIEGVPIIYKNLAIEGHNFILILNIFVGNRGLDTGTFTRPKKSFDQRIGPMVADRDFEEREVSDVETLAKQQEESKLFIKLTKHQNVN